MVAMLQGEIEPVWKSAPFTKLLAVSCGPGGETISVKVAVKLPTVALTVAVPAVAPAVAVTCACPLLPVTAVVDERVTGPDTENWTV